MLAPKTITTINAAVVAYYVQNLFLNGSFSPPGPPGNPAVKDPIMDFYNEQWKWNAAKVGFLDPYVRR